MRAREDPRQRPLCDLLHTPSARLPLLRRAPVACPGERRLLLPGLWSSGRNKHSIAVHHRVPGKSLLQTMISLCLSCHAKVHRTKAVLSDMPPLLLELWREQHPYGHEQTMLDFRAQQPPAVLVHCSMTE